MSAGHLRIVEADRVTAHRYINHIHRHHDAPAGERWRLAAVDGTGLVRGVALIGRPVARAADTGDVLEVTRLATDGYRNCCSFLYGAARRLAWAVGAAKIQTYILASEEGTSLRAAGWVMEAELPPRYRLGWDNRPGRQTMPEGKQRWAALNKHAWGGVVQWPALPAPPRRQRALFSGPEEGA